MYALTTWETVEVGFLKLGELVDVDHRVCSREPFEVQTVSKWGEGFEDFEWSNSEGGEFAMVLSCW